MTAASTALTVETVFLPEEDRPGTHLTNYMIFSATGRVSGYLGDLPLHKHHMAVAIDSVEDEPSRYKHWEFPGKQTGHGAGVIEEQEALRLRLARSSDPSYAKSSMLSTIAKPAGQVTRVTRGGYSLRAVLGWDRMLYKHVQTQIRSLARQHLEIGLTLKKQNPAKVALVCNEAVRELDILRRYDNDWVVLDFLTIYLGNMAGKEARTVNS